jgi:hypothetical protein
MNATRPPGHLCKFCRVNWIPAGAVRCPCGASYYAQGGCLTTFLQLAVIAISVLWWGLVWVAFAMGQMGGVAGFIAFFVGNFITLQVGVRLINKLTMRPSWHSQPPPNVIVHTRYR